MYIQVAKVDILVWLLGLRLGLHGLHGFRLLLVRLLSRRPSIAPVKATDATTDAAAGSSFGVLVDEQRQKEQKEEEKADCSDRVCGLCRESMRAPACTPCGHAYCWRCLLALCASGGSSSRSGGATVACPACRHAFVPQQIRVLYGY